MAAHPAKIARACACVSDRCSLKRRAVRPPMKASASSGSSLSWFEAQRGNAADVSGDDLFVLGAVRVPYGGVYPSHYK